MEGKDGRDGCKGGYLHIYRSIFVVQNTMVLSRRAYPTTHDVVLDLSRFAYLEKLSFFLIPETEIVVPSNRSFV